MMKRFFPILVIATCILGCSNNENQELSHTLNQAIDDFNSAFEKGDVFTLDQMITEGYLHTNNSWKAFGRDQWLGYMKDRSEKIKTDSLRVTNYQFTERQIQIYMNTAVVTGLVTSEGIEMGQPFSKKFRVSNVWVYENGSWKRGAFHDTWITQ